MLVSVQNITKSFAGDVVLQNVSLDIGDEDRIGLLGVNGAGKTTLLNIIAGTLEVDSGAVSRAKNLEIGYLQQNDALDSNKTLQQEAEDAFAKAYQLKDAIAACCQKLEAAPEDATLLAELDRLTVRFEAMDGYHLEDRTNRVLNGLGFGSFARDTVVSTLSGGEKMRFAIAKMLLRQPDVLILDEPTNHLDFSMLSWLENYLASYKGAVLVVSHDRYFLDTVAQDICEVERHTLTRYKGGYSSFVVQKAERRKTALRAWQKQQEEIEKMEEFVRKNLARSASASGVGTRVKQLEKMERLEKPAPEPKSISLRFTYDIEPFNLVLHCENLGVYVGDQATGRQLYTGVNLDIRRGEKIALVGMNGVGKSTFLKAIQNKIEHDGLVQWGGNVRVGYFDQELAGLNMEDTVLEAVHSRYPTKTEFEIRSALGKLLLEGDAVYKKVKELSGANRAKVAFAILEMQRANVLLLDEPTNHLDYRAKEELEAALTKFSGTLLAVSHDRYFLRRVPSRILEMRPDGFEQYNGNYDYYLEKKQLAAEQELAAIEEAKEERKAKEPTAYRSKQQRAQDAQRRTRILEVEKEVARLEEAIEAHNAALAAPENAADYESLAKWSDELKADSTALEAAMEEWLELTEADE
ncbi:ATP-binding cassette domain-containing protein [Ruminococcaceae bacterium OttesenSCG-928-A16]|nr:ATP-binding cassette domain-containing protein [Ruminococcaceae bacterium OttesenSCG-928-A16]